MAAITREMQQYASNRTSSVHEPIQGLTPPQHGLGLPFIGKVTEHIEYLVWIVWHVHCRRGFAM